MASKGLVLTGFMGVGKSTVGPFVAEQLGLGYYDTDVWMEEEGIDVPKLVRTDMPKFRSLEIAALKTILQDREPSVVSTGGGIVSTPLGRKALLEVVCPVVWMQAPFEDLATRVSKDTGRPRPLFEDRDEAYERFVERTPWYEQTASHYVDASAPIPEVVRDTVHIGRLAA